MTATSAALPSGAALPPELSLIGRDADVAAIERALATARVTTVVGPGGVGKTRIARAVVWQHRASPVATCELIPVPLPNGVPNAIAEALGAPSLDAAVIAVGSTPRLLFVDNAEHHLDVVATSVMQLIEACPGLRVLVTSQEPLDVTGEQVVVIDPLIVPTDDADATTMETAPAVQLFLERAAAIGVGIEETSIPTVAAIVRRLDGLPLAIELAAARTRGLGVQDILRHLDARFELLRRHRARGPERHRSLEAAIGWSYERLDPAVQRFFARLGAFCGPFTADAAHNVAAPEESLATTLDRLDRLVSRSLVDAIERNGQVGYVLPESVRLYARHRLDELAETDVCDARCVDHYVHLAGQLVAGASDSWSIATIRLLGAAHLNLGDAIRWCLVTDEDRTRAAILFAPLWGLVHNGRAAIVRDLGERILERWPEPRDATWAITAAITAAATSAAGDVELGDRQVAEVLEVDEGLGALIATRARYLAASHAGDDAEALRLLDHVRALGTAVGSVPFVVEADVFRASSLAALGDLDAAARAAERARRRAADDDGEILGLFADLTHGAILARRGSAEGRTLLDSTVERAQQVGYVWAAGAGHRALGAIAVIDGDRSGAIHRLGRSLDTFLEAGQLGEVAGTLRWIAGLLASADHPAAAARLLLPVAPNPPLLAALEREYLAGALAGIDPAGALELRIAVADARTALDLLTSESVASGEQASVGGPTVAPATDSQDGAETGATAARWVKEGPVWALTFDGRTVRLPHAKGVADLAELVHRPGVEISAAELMGAVVESADLGPTIDAEARRAYERRIIELQEQLDEAESFGDLRRAEVSREELDRIVDVLMAATGLGGRDRRVGDSSERARSAVTRRIKDSIRRIGEVHPQLGDHLAASVRTGRWCAYEPSEPPGWMVER